MRSLWVLGAVATAMTPFPVGEGRIDDEARAIRVVRSDATTK